MNAADFGSWEISGLVTFADGPGGLVQLRVDGPLAKALIYLHGAHVAEYQPKGEAPVLFMSAASQYAAGKAIRGGVPLIFPWFGPRAGDPESPAHGFARTSDWELESVDSADGENVEIVLKLAASDATRALWPHDFVLRHRIRVGKTLELTLEVGNTSAAAIEFEEAFHTYYAISEIREISIHGLNGATFIDDMDGKQRKIQSSAPITFAAEMESVYVDTKAACEIVDPGLGRKIRVSKSGSDTSVVWNPWIAKSASMKDMGDDEWPKMVCIETANTGANRVTLEAGGVHRMSVEIAVPTPDVA